VDCCHRYGRELTLLSAWPVGTLQANLYPVMVGLSLGLRPQIASLGLGLGGLGLGLDLGLESHGLGLESHGLGLGGCGLGLELESHGLGLGLVNLGLEKALDSFDRHCTLVRANVACYCI